MQVALFFATNATQDASFKLIADTVDPFGNDAVAEKRELGDSQFVFIVNQLWYSTIFCCYKPFDATINTISAKHIYSSAYSIIAP